MYMSITFHRLIDLRLLECITQPKKHRIHDHEYNI